MSVIFDALKKVEDIGSNNKDKNNVGQTSIIEKATNKTLKSQKAVRVNKKIFIYIAVILGLSLFFFNSIKKTVKEIVFDGKNKDFVSKDYTFAPEPEKKYAKGKLVLEGIIYDQNFPMAIINGAVLKVGEKIDQFQVLSITKNTVQLINDQTSKQIELIFK